MNIDQQQQNLSAAPPPPSQLTAEYVNFSSVSGSGQMTPASGTTTFVTIGILPPTQQLIPSLASHSNTTCGTTSTFKTPLLPMPSLDDIEGSSMMPTSSTSQQTGASQHQQSQQQQPIPGGILKYPSCSSATMNMPIGLGPGPPPLQTQAQTLQQISNNEQQQMPLAYQSNVLPTISTAAAVSSLPLTMQQIPPNSLNLNDATTCGTLKSNAKLLPPAMGSSGLSVSSAVQQPLMSGINSGMSSTGKCNLNTSKSSSGAGIGIGATSVSSASVVSAAGPGAGAGAGVASITTPTATNLRHKSSTTTVNSSITGNNSGKTKAKTKCCACFGTPTSEANSKSRKRKQKHPTMWSALLTNLGICALLLAYTLLGSFIFLTIESEDSLHQQHTLASTKRGGGLNGRLSSGTTTGAGNNIGSGSGSGSSSSGTSSSNIYQTQQQSGIQQNYQHNMDNSTMTSSSSSSTLSSSSSLASSSSSSGSSSSSSSLSSSSSFGSGGMLEGMIPFDGNSNNDFIYGDDAVPQYALSPDTYDVRQRTIENIWDITVSLNILYKENWTKLAALEIAKFQDQLIKRLNEDAIVHLTHETVDGQSPSTEAVLLHTHYHHRAHYEWDFAKAFLYSLTVLTTVGYGNIAPRTTLGRLVTLIYAFFGIPLTLVYLSSTGGILAKVAREVFSKALCCCLCSNCGYCCYDEKRMAEKERRMRRKRQQEELRKQQAAMQEPYYVRSNSLHDNYQTPEKQTATPTPLGQMPPDIDSLSASESRGSMHGLSILAPILLCFSMMIIYILFGALMLYRLENWPLIDGIYFCFMSLSTIGFGDMLPILRRDTTATTWFISIYIMSGMALTAMCFNVIHEEIVNRIKIVVEFKKDLNMEAGTGGPCQTATGNDDSSYYMPP